LGGAAGGYGGAGGIFRAVRDLTEEPLTVQARPELVSKDDKRW